MRGGECMDYSKKPTVIIVGEKKKDASTHTSLTSAQTQTYREEVHRFFAEQSQKYRFNADGTCTPRK